MCIPVWTVPMGCWNRPHTQRIQVAYIYFKILEFFQMIELHILLVPQVRAALLKNYLHWLWNVNCVPAKWVFWDFFVHSTQNNTSYKFAMRLFGYIWEKIIFLPTKTLKTSIIRGELDREHQFLGIVRKKLYIAHDIHKNWKYDLRNGHGRAKSELYTHWLAAHWMDTVDYQ